MVALSCEIQINDSVLKRFQAAARINGVSVGYPEGVKYPNGESPAAVARTQEFGTPRIPPRPFIRRTIDSRKGHWGRTIATGLKQFKTEDKIRKMWEQRGKAIVVNLQQSIDRVMSPPLSPFTIARRKAHGNNSNKPLIDTGTMRNELAYKVAGGDWQK